MRSVKKYTRNRHVANYMLINRFGMRHICSLVCYKPLILDNCCCVAIPPTTAALSAIEARYARIRRARIRLAGGCFDHVNGAQRVRLSAAPTPQGSHRLDKHARSGINLEY